jgi:hypothetical protein
LIITTKDTSKPCKVRSSTEGELEPNYRRKELKRGEKKPLKKEWQSNSKEWQTAGDCWKESVELGVKRAECRCGRIIKGASVARAAKF